MSSAPVNKSLASMDLGSSQRGMITAGQPSSPSVTCIRCIDWILIPDLCDAASVVNDPETDIGLIHSVDVICPSSQRQRRPWPQSGQNPGLSIKDQEPQTVDFVKGHRPASTEYPEQNPPSRPSPRRLPTPDLPDLDEAEFWPSKEHLVQYHGNIKGSLWLEGFCRTH